MQTSSYNFFRVLKEKYNFLLNDLGKEKAVKATEIEKAKMELDDDMKLLNDELLSVRVLGERKTQDSMILYYEKLLSTYSSYADELESFIVNLNKKEESASRSQLQSYDEDLAEEIIENPIKPLFSDDEAEPVIMPTDAPRLPKKKMLGVELKKAITQIWANLPLGERTSTNVYNKLDNLNIDTSRQTVWRYMNQLKLGRDGGEIAKNFTQNKENEAL
ncbi:MAG: hypothetical protein KKD44_29260 [Proteobacteria bacterium]|nr:hypothetical protein [Pseudomonadota bacterium]